MSVCNVPIIFMIFNRPDVTQQVFNAIRQAQPRELLIIADGPRDHVESDADNCRETRKILEQVDWDCDVTYDFSDDNLGCKRRVATGITRGFELFEKAIILEDDCVPHPDFFPYCECLLDRYMDHEEIMHISGFLAEPWPQERPDSYCFLRNAFVWGWATWRRAWQKYDITMEAWKQDGEELLAPLGLPEHVIARMRKAYDRTAAGQIDTWDYQWIVTLLSNQGLSIAPCANLISNIGFDERATHTTSTDSDRSARPVMALPQPLHHPDTIEAFDLLDRCILEQEHGVRKKRTLMQRLRRSFSKRLNPV